MIEIEKPRIETTDLKPDGTYGKFIVEPLESPADGTTLGNSLRRVLLSSLPGYAITSVKIQQRSARILHAPRCEGGRYRDCPELKNVILKIHGDGPRLSTLKAAASARLPPAGIQTDCEVEILNPELPHCFAG